MPLIYYIYYPASAAGVDLTVGDTDFGNDDTISSVCVVDVDGNPGRISLLPFELKFLGGLSKCKTS